MGSMTILNRTGDETLEWDPAHQESIDTAQAKFDDLKKQGYNFYETVETRGKQVTKFDPKAGKLIAAPGAKSASDKQTGKRGRAMAGGPVASTHRLA